MREYLDRDMSLSGEVWLSLVTSEDDDGSPEHLEGTGVGESEANILETGGSHITQCRSQKYLNKEK